MAFFVAYAYDWLPDGKPRTGVPWHQLGTMHRLNVLISIYNKRKNKEPIIHDRFVLTAGRPHESSADQETMGAQMEKYLRSERVHPTSLGIRGEVWGTYAETLAAIERIESISERHWIHHPEVYVCTNLGHMPRVWLCWFFLASWKWCVHYKVAWEQSFTPQEWLQETGKFVVYFFKFLFRRW